MVTGKQGITIRAKNKNAKYKVTTTKSQSISSTKEGYTIKYTYSRLISAIVPKKYSYAV